MNRVLQPDVHPDAESLNAFVEQALPQPERAQIVAHLGGCARCREVVFLAEAAAEADAPPLADVKTESHPAKSRWPWWREKWRLALIPAAALATALALLIWVQKNSAPPAPTVAQISHPSPVPSAVAPEVPRPAQTASASAPPPVAVQHAQPKAARAERRNPPSETLSVNGLSASEQTPELPPPVPQLRAPDRLSTDRNLSALASKQSDMNAGVISSLEIAAQPPPAPGPPNLAAVHGSLMAPATGGPRPLAAGAATSSQVELMPQPVNGPAALRLASHPRLPSGLNAVSSAVMLDRILAVDPDGAVFLSRDAAKHWERVPIQWTGKVVSVQAPPRALYPFNAKVKEDETVHTSPVASVSMMPAPPAPAPDAPPPPVPSMKAAESANAAPGPPPAPDAAPATPGMLFKLINDHHQTWVSADGKVWHEQQGRE